MLYRFIVIIIGCIIVMTPTVHAVETDSAGLAISPVRDEVVLKAGQSSVDTLTVTNRTDRAMTVRMDVKSFSVTDHTYDYRFKPLEYSWIKLDVAQMSLNPHQQATLSYAVEVPEDAASGGYYFVLIASTSMMVHGVTSTVQAAMPLYVTVDGGNLRRSSTLENDKVPFLVMGDMIFYTYDAKNTGNVHINASFTTRLEDLWGNHAQTIESHAIFPGTIRSVSGSLQAPLLPGVYRLVYGYTTKESSQDETLREAYIINLPPWSIAAGALLAFTGLSIRQYVKHQRNTSARKG